MGDVIELNSKQPAEIFDDTCDRCAYSLFKVPGQNGECRANPPHAGIIMVPRQTIQGMSMEPMPYSVFPGVAPDHFCYNFDPKDLPVH